MKAVRELVLGCFLAAFQPRSTRGLGDWMGENIVVRPTENPGKAGPYDSGYTPLVAKLYDDFLRGEWDELGLMKGGQAGASMHALGWLVRCTAEDPGNAMYVIDSDKEAKNISERLQAMLEDSPATKGIVAVADGEGDMTTLLYRFPTMNLWLTGAGSAGSLANKTAVRAVGDEVDKHRQTKGEPTTLDMLRIRGKEQEGFKFLYFSTPTTVTGQIYKEYCTGSRHKAYVPCPHCGVFQVLTWPQVKFGHCRDLTGEWDLEEVRRSTYYECSGCQGKIHDHHKRVMVARGEWRATYFKTVQDAEGKDREVPAWIPGKMSAHYPDLYSQSSNVSFGRLAVKFIHALKDPMKMRDFRQSHLGEPDEEVFAEVTEDAILALRGPYKRQRRAIGAGDIVLPGEEVDAGSPIPIKPLFCALLEDTQDANSKWSIQAFADNGDQYVIDWGACLELNDLDAVRARTVWWRVKDPETGEVEEGRMPVSVTQLDEGGHRSYEVREWCFRRFPECFSSRGAFGGGGASVSIKDARIKNQEGAPLVPVLGYDDNTFKRELYIRRIAKFDAEKASAYGQSRLWLPLNLETAFTAELMKERLERQKDGSYKWNEPKGNDWGDTVKMGIILWVYLSPELLRAVATERQAAAATL